MSRFTKQFSAFILLSLWLTSQAFAIAHEFSAEHWDQDTTHFCLTKNSDIKNLHATQTNLAVASCLVSYVSISSEVTEAKFKLAYKVPPRAPPAIS